jgi:hypothetical protein
MSAMGYKRTCPQSRANGHGPRTDLTKGSAITAARIRSLLRARSYSYDLFSNLSVSGVVPASSSSRSFAVCRTGVSNPSVNQP